MPIRPSNTRTIEEVAIYMRVRPSLIRTLIKRGEIKTRLDGLISARALKTAERRWERIGWRYLQLRREGMPAAKASAKARREEERRRGK